VGEYNRQHTVTEAYLRRLTGPDRSNTLWRYDKSTGVWKECNVANATVSFYHYSVKDDDGDHDHSVEIALGKIEDAAIPLLDRLQRGERLTIQNVRAVAVFIATMVRRNSHIVSEMQQIGHEIMDDPRRRKEVAEAVVRDMKE
jgi:hypothetical protein